MVYFQKKYRTAFVSIVAILAISISQILSGEYYIKYNESDPTIEKTESEKSPTLIEEQTPLDQKKESEEEKPGEPIPKSTIPEQRPVSPYLQGKPIPPQKIEPKALEPKKLAPLRKESKPIEKIQLQKKPIEKSGLSRSPISKQHLEKNKLEKNALPNNRISKNPLPR
jgi:hypothetical protein